MIRRTHPARPAMRLSAAIGVAFALFVGIADAQESTRVRIGGAESVTAPDPVPETSAKRLSVVEALKRRGDLKLRGSTLDGALLTIGDLWGVNIVAGEVQGQVNGVFEDAPLREILDTILLSNGYAYRPVGGSLVVSRMEELGQVNPFFVTETIAVGAAKADEVVEAARLLSTPQGQVRALPSAGSILVVDFPDRVERIRALVGQIDVATRALAAPGGGGLAPARLEVAYFRTHYIRAVEAQAALAPVLSQDGRVSALDGEDRLLVVDYADNVAMVEAVLQRIDRPRPQVNIRALIYDISLTDAEKLGINWNGITDGVIDEAGVATGQNTGLRFLTQTAAPLGATDSGGQFSFFTFEGNLDIRAVAIALQEAQDSRLLADPNVTVSDNEPARIESIQEVPFQQLTQTGNGGQIGTTSFREAGVKLDVTPKIASDGSILMTVVPEFSRVAGFTPGDNQPIIETRRATTEIRVQNSQTAMIAGLRQRSDVGEFDGVPYLKDIRFLGHLFRARDTQIVESELVVFLTPQIVGFSDPLGHRDRLTSDTVDCRLERIPAAEGCPPCGGCGACGACNGGGAVHGPIEYTPGSLHGSPTPETVSPPPVPEQASIERLEQPELVRSNIRRLPPVDDAVTPASGAAVSTADPMRPDYESRFRATGGVYASQQRREDPKPKESQRTADRSWYERIFRR